MLKFEHKLVHPPSSDEGLEALLNEWGANGFKYVGMVYDKLIMVREDYPQMASTVAPLMGQETKTLVAEKAKPEKKAK
jgi:hypothetical protein